MTTAIHSSQQKQSYCNKIPAKIKLYGDFTNSVFSAVTKSFNIKKIIFIVFVLAFAKFQQYIILY